MTAVEWLQDKWGNCKEWSWEEIKQWFEQAKQMEKQQIIDACNQPYFDDISAMGKPITKGEQYYDETYREQLKLK